MLVLRRRVGEILLLSGGIELEVIAITRSRVKLGIRAPKSVVVQRKESVPVAEENIQASRLMLTEDGTPQFPISLVEAILSRSIQIPSQQADM